MKKTDRDALAIMGIAILLVIVAMASILGCAPMRDVRAPFTEHERRTREWVNQHIGNPNTPCIDGYEYRCIYGQAEIETLKLQLAGIKPNEVEAKIKEKGVDVQITKIEDKGSKTVFQGKVKPTRMSEKEIEAIKEFIKFEERLVVSAKVGVIKLLSKGQHDQDRYGIGGCISIAF